MPLIIQHLLDQFLLFTVVLARLSGLVMTAPILGTQEVPILVRTFLAFTLALLITPLQSSAGFAGSTDLLNYAIVMASELMVGLSLGVGIMLLFSGVQMTGQIISQMSGMSLADVFSPGFDDNVPVFAQFVFLVAMSAFAILGGHRLVLDGLLGTFANMPPGQAGVADSVASTVIHLLTQSFVLGIRAAAPAMVALLLSTLVLGFVGRTLPQLNIFAVGFNLSAIVTLGTLLITLTAIVWVFVEQVEPTLEVLLDSLQPRTAS